ncbi:semaphorin-4A-like [Micropterus salmoides]|uniref:semaphorin-4A-like n=1 Tax=Micropterus salmoides TaxID=27706 RepID=UPI0018EA4D3E|nr:semaphorin-4A-like [Micropterus salmoides]
MVMFHPPAPALGRQKEEPVVTLLSRSLSALSVGAFRAEKRSQSILSSSVMPPSVVVLLLLLGLLSSAGSLPPPRNSFLLNSADRPLVLFSLPDVHNTTTLLLSDDGSTLYVGARDAILSLDVSQSDVIHLKKKVEWSPSESEIEECQLKGKDAEVDCPNFVRVLQPINSTHLYACGSYAYNPHDAYIDAESFSMVKQDRAKGRCPFNPFQRNTAITVDSELFTTTTTDFRGAKPQISRHFSKDGGPDVSLDTSISLLHEPVFVSSSLDSSDRKLYFFFSEVGKEFSFVNDLRIARVAQVCKDDVGGQRTLQKKWTSFAKAPLLCQSPKRLPFNVLQDVFTLQPPEGTDASETLFYAAFTSQWSSGPESAVCVFKLQDVREAFTESYRTFDMRTHQWSQQLGKHSYLGQCGLDNASDSELAEVKRSFLTNNGVKPVGVGPLVVSSGQQYSRVAAMRTQAADGKQYTVLFLLTESGFLHKVVLLNRGAHIIEEIQVFTQPQLVKNIILSPSKGVLYVGTSEGVTAVPVARCSIYRSCSQCILARDPLCGWSRTSRVCTGLDSSHENIVQHLEDDNVENECQIQTRASWNTEVGVHLNEAVRLQCQKPSNLATLTWTSPRFRNLPEKLFILSADGSLSFLATADTFGIYRCEAVEGGYKEEVASYAVRQIASPRSMNPIPKADENLVTNGKDEPYEDILTDAPVITTIQSSGDLEDYKTNYNGDKIMTNFNVETILKKEDSGLKNPFLNNGLDFTSTSRKDAQSGNELPEDTRMPKEKSYYTELVIVSLLLATCICLLIFGGIHMWRHRRTGLKKNPLVSPEGGSKTNQSMESVPSLSSPEDLDVKVG